MKKSPSSATTTVVASLKALFLLLTLVATFSILIITNNPLIFGIDGDISRCATLTSADNPTILSSFSTTTTATASTTTTSSSTTLDDYRKYVQKKCQPIVQAVRQKKKFGNLMSSQKVQLTFDSLSHIYSPIPDMVSDELPTDHRPYPINGCTNAFIDLGTNIGDTLSYFIDNALDVCTTMLLDKVKDAHKLVPIKNETFPRPYLDVTELEYKINGIFGSGNGITMNNALLFIIEKFRSLNILPEDTCLFGMEGNPRFTRRLQKLENFLVQTQPRLFHHMHIHTESVATENNGITQLYLDEISTTNNVSTTNVDLLLLLLLLLLCVFVCV